NRETDQPRNPTRMQRQRAGRGDDGEQSTRQAGDDYGDERARRADHEVSPDYTEALRGLFAPHQRCHAAGGIGAATPIRIERLAFAEGAASPTVGRVYSGSRQPAASERIEVGIPLARTSRDKADGCRGIGIAECRVDVGAHFESARTDGGPE